MLRLPRKMRLRCSKCCACYANAATVLNRRRTSVDLPGGAPRAAPATQKETKVLQVLHLPRKMTMRCSKCCATQTQPASTVLNRRRTSADLPGGAPRAAPATQNETKVLQVLHLPRKMRLRRSKCCACHANAAGVHSTQSSPDFRGPLC